MSEKDKPRENESKPDAEGDSPPELQSRRDFLRGLGRWSAIIIGAVGAANLLEPPKASGWVNNGGGWANGRGSNWLNNGGWLNGGNSGGSWINGGSGSGGRGDGGGWVNRNAGWINGGGGSWANSRGGWVNR